MIKKINLIVGLLGYTSHLFAAQAPRAGHLQMRHATKKDLPGVVALMNRNAYKDADKIVVVPKKFRADYIGSAIAKKQLFVAANGKEIVGYKKLFCLRDQKEINELLSNELRCVGLQAKLAACASLSLPDAQVGHLNEATLTSILESPVTYVYNGADYSHPAYRGKGINSQLTGYALNTVSQQVAHCSLQDGSRYLALAYGLTHDNAGDPQDLLAGRSGGIVKQFVPFAQKIAKLTHSYLPKQLFASRHHAYKPSFDEDSQECIPLPDEHAIPGYGCLVVAPMEKREES